MIVSFFLKTTIKVFLLIAMFISIIFQDCYSDWRTFNYVSIGSENPLDQTSDIYEMTENLQTQRMAIWSGAKVDLTKSFLLRLKVNFGNGHDNGSSDNGADGIAFVIHNDDAENSAHGGTGYAIGYAKNTQDNVETEINPSIAIEFDTFNNPLENDLYDDINVKSIDHIAFVKDAEIANPQSQYPIFVDGNGNHIDVELGHWYCIDIAWNPTSGRMTVYVNGVQRNYKDFSDLIGDLDPTHNLHEFWWGLTAATFTETNLQQLQFRSFSQPGDINHTVDLMYNGVSVGCEPLKYLCKGSNATLSINNPAGCNVEWSSIEGGVATVLSETTSSIIVSPNVTTVYRVKLTCTDGSYATDEVTINVSDFKVKLVLQPTNLIMCAGEQKKLSALVAINPASDYDYSSPNYNWSFEWFENEIPLNNMGQLEYFYYTNFPYGFDSKTCKVIATYNDVNFHCTANAEVTLTEKVLTAVPKICNADDILLHVGLSSNDPNDTDPLDPDGFLYHYQWSGPNGFTCNSKNCTTSSNYGTYTVTVSSSNTSEGCQVTASVDILKSTKFEVNVQIIKHTPNPKVTCNTNTTCSPFQYIYQYWDDNTSNWRDIITAPLHNSTDPTIEFDDDNITSHRYKVIVEDKNGCIASKEFTINPLLSTFTAWMNYAVCIGESIQLRVHLEDNSHNTVNDYSSYHFEWTPKNGLDNPYTAEPNANPDVTTVYSVKVIDANGWEFIVKNIQVNVVDQIENFMKRYYYLNQCSDFSIVKGLVKAENCGFLLYGFQGDASYEYPYIFQVSKDGDIDWKNRYIYNYNFNYEIRNEQSFGSS